MINQQLLDYIRQQIAIGASKESIKQALDTQGWSEQDVNEGFVELQKITTIPTSYFTPPITPIRSPVMIDNQNSIWTKGIPRTNKVFMIISLLLVFGLDLTMILSDRSLIGFWYMMLGVLAVFAAFFYLENFVFRKKFTNSVSNLDKGIVAIVFIRNLIFLLNFIPFIQILGLATIVYVGWLVGLIYLGLMVVRFSQTKKVIASSI